MTDIKTLTRSFSDALEHRTRDNGETFVCLRDDAPDWMRDICYAAHDNGDILPDDWRFRMIESMIDAIADYVDANGELPEVGDLHESIDNFVPVANYDRAQWLASNMTRAGYCDEAQENGLVADDADIWQRLAIGIYTECEEVAGSILAELAEVIEETDA